MITVVIPYYRGLDDLKDLLTIRLVPNKSVSKIIIIDDGAIEALDFEIINLSRKITIIKQVNSGPAIARKNGLSSVDTEFVHFMDADDQVSSNFYEDCLNYMNDDIDCVCSNVKVCRNEGGQLKTLKMFVHERTSYSGYEYSKHILHSRVPTFFQNKIFRVSALNSDKLSDARINEDVSSIWRQTLGMKKINVASDATLFYVQHHASVMQTYDFNKVTQRIDVFNWIDATVSPNEASLWRCYRNVYFNNVVLLGSLKMLYRARKWSKFVEFHCLLARTVNTAKVNRPNKFTKKAIITLPSWTLLTILRKYIQ